MQVQTVNAMWYDRREAGHLLSRNLDVYRSSHSVVVGIPHGGVEVASVVAEELHLPLEVISCRTILNPADSRKNIGSVSEDEVYLHDCAYTLPQDYICHQIAKLRGMIAAENRKYHGNGDPLSLTNRSVILVDDMLTCSDTMITCLRSIRKQNPLKIIVAVPVISMEAAIVVDAEADEIIYLKMETCPEAPDAYFANFPQVNDAHVRELLDVSKLSYDAGRIASSTDKAPHALSPE